MDRLGYLVCVLALGCSSSPPRTETAKPEAAPIAIDAGIDAAADAGLPAAVLEADRWIFRYSTADRAETWTLQHADGQALVVVESKQGTLRYQGTATDGDSLAIVVTSATAKLVLDCKRTKRGIGAKCNDRKAKPIDLLDCYHPDFKEPMPFGKAPGVEYAVDKSCNGYRLVPSS